jgi:putative membrane protein
MMRSNRQPAFCLAVVLVVMGWSLCFPHDLFTWFLEAVPVLIALPLLAVTYRPFRMTGLLYGLIAAHCIILLVGAHYTYAEVPLFNYLRDHFHLARNYYDRVGHFIQGFVPAIIGRELLIRTSSLRSGKWLSALLFFSCLGISATYELFEWLMSLLTGEAADAFLGTQGDIWDTQWDMLWAGVGAAAALIFLSGFHDKALEKLPG